MNVDDELAISQADRRQDWLVSILGSSEWAKFRQAHAALRLLLIEAHDATFDEHEHQWGCLLSTLGKAVNKDMLFKISDVGIAK